MIGIDAQQREQQQEQQEQQEPRSFQMATLLSLLLLLLLLPALAQAAAPPRFGVATNPSSNTRCSVVGTWQAAFADRNIELRFSADGSFDDTATSTATDCVANQLQARGQYVWDAASSTLTMTLRSCDSTAENACLVCARADTTAVAVAASFDDDCASLTLSTSASRSAAVYRRVASSTTVALACTLQGNGAVPNSWTGTYALSSTTSATEALTFFTNGTYTSTLHAASPTGSCMASSFSVSGTYTLSGSTLILTWNRCSSTPLEWAYPRDPDQSTFCGSCPTSSVNYATQLASDCSSLSLQKAGSTSVRYAATFPQNECSLRGRYETFDVVDNSVAITDTYTFYGSSSGDFVNRVVGEVNVDDYACSSNELTISGTFFVTSSATVTLVTTGCQATLGCLQCTGTFPRMVSYSVTYDSPSYIPCELMLLAPLTGGTSTEYAPNNDLSTGALVGILIGAIVACVAVALLAFGVTKYYHKRAYSTLP